MAALIIDHSENDTHDEPVVVSGGVEETESTPAGTPACITPMRDVVQRKDPEDPFVESPDNNNKNQAVVDISTPAQQMLKSLPNTAVKYTQETGFTPRPDRLVQPITPANAQGVFPPEALVFVAK